MISEIFNLKSGTVLLQMVLFKKLLSAFFPFKVK